MRNENVSREHKAHKSRYGSPHIYQELVQQGHSCSENPVARLMRKDGLKAKTKRRYKATANSTHNFPVTPNLLQWDFSPNTPTRSGLAISPISGLPKAGFTLWSSSTCSPGLLSVGLWTSA